MKLVSIMKVTLTKLIIKFGYDQINISYGKMLLKTCQIPEVNMPNTLNMTELCSTTWLSKHGAERRDRCIFGIYFILCTKTTEIPKAFRLQIFTASLKTSHGEVSCFSFTNMCSETSLGFSFD